jgi:hypothetical protein
MHSITGHSRLDLFSLILIIQSDCFPYLLLDCKIVFDPYLLLHSLNVFSIYYYTARSFSRFPYFLLYSKLFSLFIIILQDGFPYFRKELWSILVFWRNNCKSVILIDTQQMLTSTFVNKWNVPLFIVAKINQLLYLKLKQMPISPYTIWHKLNFLFHMFV